jgi:hypothetical protein
MTRYPNPYKLLPVEVNFLTAKSKTLGDSELDSLLILFAIDGRHEFREQSQPPLTDFGARRTLGAATR